jgi:hypothetical protein
MVSATDTKIIKRGIVLSGKLGLPAFFPSMAVTQLLQCNGGETLAQVENSAIERLLRGYHHIDQLNDEDRQEVVSASLLLAIQTITYETPRKSC